MLMIELSDIEIKYGDFIAIKGLNLTIKEGEFFTFLGPSGCGKTTILRTLVGFIKPSGGSVSVFGEDITHVSVEKRGIGMVFQSYALFPTMTVYENLAFGLKVKKLSSDKIREQVLAVAKTVEINEQQLHRNVAELSGGQQQRVALARALVLKPKILCLDEPLSNLDAKLRVGLRGELKRLQKTLGITTLYVTHDQEEALTLSDRIAVFNNGFLEQVGTPYEIYNHSKSEFVCDFIGDINRLKQGILEKVNTVAGTSFSTEKTGFIRIERVAITDQERSGWVSFEGKVLDFEYNGILTKYTLQVGDEQLKCIEKNDGTSIHKDGESVCVALNPQDIMQF
jgi:iron(III) transport system ATP-binding protein